MGRRRWEVFNLYTCEMLAFYSLMTYCPRLADIVCWRLLGMQSHEVRWQVAALGVGR